VTTTARAPSPRAPSRRRHRPDLPAPARRGDLLPDAAAPGVRGGRDVHVVVRPVAEEPPGTLRRAAGLHLADVPPRRHLRERQRRGWSAPRTWSASGWPSRVPAHRGRVDPRHPRRPARRAIDSVRYVTGGQETAGQVEKAALALGGRVQLEPVGPGRTLSAMLAGGEIDALYTPRIPSPFAAATLGCGGCSPTPGPPRRSTSRSPASSRSCTWWSCAATSTSGSRGWRSRSTRRCCWPSSRPPPTCTIPPRWLHSAVAQPGPGAGARAHGRRLLVVQAGGEPRGARDLPALPLGAGPVQAPAHPPRGCSRPSPSRPPSSDGQAATTISLRGVPTSSAASAGIDAPVASALRTTM